MANCAKCGAALLEGAVFCGSCGAAVTPPAPPPRVIPPISMEEGAGFFASLFDFSFTEFITTKLIKFLYGLGMLLGAVMALALIITGFAQSVITGILFLILSPVIFLLYVVGARVWLEIVIVIFRISEHTENIAKNTGR
ncbi:MAG: DUF4282 domain-containing protein [Terriglobia bacterium]